MDVGVDNAAKILGEYRPFAWEEVRNILYKRPGHSLDHHVPGYVPTEEELIN
jgi:hypothetical protein